MAIKVYDYLWHSKMQCSSNPKRRVTELLALTSKPASAYKGLNSTKVPELTTVEMKETQMMHTNM